MRRQLRYRGPPIDWNRAEARIRELAGIAREWAATLSLPVDDADWDMDIQIGEGHQPPSLGIWVKFMPKQSAKKDHPSQTAYDMIGAAVAAFVAEHDLKLDTRSGKSVGQEANLIHYSLKLHYQRDFAIKPAE